MKLAHISIGIRREREHAESNTRVGGRSAIKQASCTNGENRIQSKRTMTGGMERDNGKGNATHRNGLEVAVEQARVLQERQHNARSHGKMVSSASCGRLAARKALKQEASRTQCVGKEAVTGQGCTQKGRRSDRLTFGSYLFHVESASSPGASSSGICELVRAYAACMERTHNPCQRGDPMAR